MTKQKTSHVRPSNADQDESAAIRRPPGRPIRHHEPTMNVSITLLHSQDFFLAQLIVDINARSRTRISKSEIIRGLIQALIDSQVDLTSSRSESDVATIINAKLVKKKTV